MTKPRHPDDPGRKRGPMRRTILLSVACMAALAVVSPFPAAAQEDGQREELIEEIVAWVNDDVVLLTDLRELEQAAIQGIVAQGDRAPGGMTSQVKAVKERVLMELIWNRLLVQEAEQLFDIESIEQELIESFMKSQGIEGIDELEKILARYGLDREMLEDRLLLQQVPDYVIDNQVRVNLGVSEDEAREYYAENQERFASEASVTFTEIVLYARSEEERAARAQEAAEVFERAAETDDMTALVEEVSEAPSRAIEGRIGPVSPDDLVEPVADALMSDAEVGSVVGPVATPQGWHILRIEDRQRAEIPPFEEVRSICEDMVSQEKFKPVFDEFIRELWNRSRIEVREPYLDRVPEAWQESVIVRN